MQVADNANVGYNPNKIRILKRQDNNGSPKTFDEHQKHQELLEQQKLQPQMDPGNQPQLSIEEREKQYEQARARIFGEENDSNDNSNVDGNINNDNDNNTIDNNNDSNNNYNDNDSNSNSNVPGLDECMNNLSLDNNNNQTDIQVPTSPAAASAKPGLILSPRPYVIKGNKGREVVENGPSSGSSSTEFNFESAKVQGIMTIIRKPKVPSDIPGDFGFQLERTPVEF
eukprot:Pgem_evm1s8898